MSSRLILSTFPITLCCSLHSSLGTRSVTPEGFLFSKEQKYKILEKKIVFSVFCFDIADIAFFMAKNSFCLVINQFYCLNFLQTFIFALCSLFSSTRGSFETNRTSSGSPMALVPYSPPLTLAKFHQTERNFTFAERTLTITQDWNDGGVAAVVWDAAIVLSKYIEKHNQLSVKKNVIELGAGTGLVGMVAALLGGNVIVTDRGMALKYINVNIENNANVLSGLPIKVEELNWGQDISQFQPPDLILGADIVYIEDTFHELFKTLLDLTGSETVVLLSCRIRYERDNKFLILLKTRFSISKVLYDNETDIVIYEAKKLSSVNTKDDL